MNLLKMDAPPEPAWEPDWGWRVLDPDGHVVNAGPRTIIYATFEIPGFDDTGVPLLDGSREKE